MADPERQESREEAGEALSQMTFRLRVPIVITNEEQAARHLKQQETINKMDAAFRGRLKFVEGNVVLEDAPAAYSKIREEVLGWFSEAYLDGAYASFHAVPPYVSFIESDSIHALQDAPWGACYLPGSNHVVVAGWPEEKEVLLNTLAHEFLHYASLSTNGGIWRYGPTATICKDWLNESITYLLSAQLLHKNGYRPSSSDYDYHVSVSAFLLQQLAGEEPLRLAYLTGDFTQVAREVDAKLGKGTFRKLLACKTGGEGRTLLRKAIEKNGIEGIEEYWHSTVSSVPGKKPKAIA